MPRLLSTASQVVQTRLKQMSRRAALRGELMFGAAVAGIVALVYALIAATVALSREYGSLTAMGIIGGVAFVVMLGFLLALWIEARRHRRLSARRAALDAQIYRAAALSLVPDRAPSRPVVGFGLVAIGAALVLLRRKD
ncbi:MAG: hypothetical protein QM699_11735 [Amaricoccus sp.]|uniref:hypothetical protein n=1 Tax=Amaricoccus sp. TaxID=1872485 RepID=UPI0039E442E3